MKKLILPLIFMPFFAQAQEMGKGLSDNDIKNKFLSTVKDVEVEKLLGASAEFNKCRKLGKFETGTEPDKQTVKLNDATTCFKEELGKKSAAELKKLSQSLALQDYGLVKSDSINDVTEYLQKKMIKSLTGRDPDEKDPEKIKEQLKWGNQKIVDQKVFIDLYKNQLMKNALFEVSRYCFENLRRNEIDSKTFSLHWDKKFMELEADKVTKIAKPKNLSTINDFGEPKFFNAKDTLDTSDKAAVYKEMLNGLTANVEIDPTQYSEYFTYCTAAMPALCNKYLDSVKIKETESSIALKAVDPKREPGAASCLAMDRLRSIRKAMDNTDKVAKQFDEMENKNGMTLQMLTDPLQYERGNGANEESLDELTSMSSADMLAKSESNKDKAQLAEDCRSGKGPSECDDYLREGDDFNKAVTRTETEMTLKRELEVARVKKMKDNIKELKEYLTENGMYELLNDLENNKLTPDDIVLEIGKVYDARKIATIEGLKLKVGNRQITEEEAKAKSPQGLNEIKAENIKASSEEKARMAQVVLFNNIITSQLSLKDKDDKSLGRNVTAWNKEIKGISEASGMSESDTLFQGLQKTAKEEGKNIDNASLVDGGIIDTILGKKSDAKKNP